MGERPGYPSLPGKIGDWWLGVPVEIPIPGNGGSGVVDIDLAGGAG
ncbi:MULTISPECIES: hypothetical protein [unclassified Frankia]|nr:MULTISPECIES: hypothetical protein [unclassified Frankia]